MTLGEEATAWTPLAPLPGPLAGARASIVGGRLRLNGGIEWGGGSKTEVNYDFTSIGLALYLLFSAKTMVLDKRILYNHDRGVFL